MADTRALLDTTIQSSTVDLFHSCGIAVAPVERSRLRPEDARYHDLSGMIGFMGSGFNGTLTVSVPLEVFGLVKQNPQRPFSGRDWAREITNQLFGRIKNRLLQFQTPVQAGLPSTMTRDAFERQCTRPGFVHYSFRTLRGDIVVTMSGTFDPALFAYNPSSNAMNEGDILLF